MLALQGERGMAWERTALCYSLFLAKNGSVSPTFGVRAQNSLIQQILGCSLHLRGHSRLCLCPILIEHISCCWVDKWFLIQVHFWKWRFIIVLLIQPSFIQLRNLVTALSLHRWNFRIFRKPSVLDLCWYCLNALGLARYLSGHFGRISIGGISL